MILISLLHFPLHAFHFYSKTESRTSCQWGAAYCVRGSLERERVAMEVSKCLFKFILLKFKCSSNMILWLHFSFSLFPNQLKINNHLFNLFCQLQYLEHRECEYDQKTLVNFYKVRLWIGLSVLFNYYSYIFKKLILYIGFTQEENCLEPALTGVIV